MWSKAGPEGAALATNGVNAITPSKKIATDKMETHFLPGWKEREVFIGVAQGPY